MGELERRDQYRKPKMSPAHWLNWSHYLFFLPSSVEGSGQQEVQLLPETPTRIDKKTLPT